MIWPRNGMSSTVRNMVVDDWANVASIYHQGIESGNATFEKDVPTWTDWEKGHISNCRIVAISDDEVIGWAALSPVSGRCVYAGVAEVSVYIAENHRGQKIGQKLLNELISESEREGIWMLQSGIFPENEASLKLHEKLGFRRVGHRERIGQMNGTWRDTVLLERRSTAVGL